MEDDRFACMYWSSSSDLRCWECMLNTSLLCTTHQSFVLSSVDFSFDGKQCGTSKCPTKRYYICDHTKIFIVYFQKSHPHLEFYLKFIVFFCGETKHCLLFHQPTLRNFFHVFSHYIVATDLTIDCYPRLLWLTVKLTWLYVKHSDLTWLASLPCPSTTKIFDSKGNLSIVLLQIIWLWPPQHLIATRDTKKRPQRHCY